MSHAGRRAAQRDQNERPIVELFRRAGWQVELTTTWDVTALAPSGDVVLVEIKTPKGRLTASQKRLIDAGWPIHVVRSLEEANALIRAFR